jgi:hypothetical protein
MNKRSFDFFLTPTLLILFYSNRLKNIKFVSHKHAVADLYG